MADEHAEQQERERKARQAEQDPATERAGARSFKGAVKGRDVTKPEAGHQPTTEQPPDPPTTPVEPEQPTPLTHANPMRGPNPPMKGIR